MKDILRVWKRHTFRLTLYYIGGDKIAYRFSDSGIKIFEGNDFRPSPMHAIDSLDSVYALLGFLSLQKGDTDAEYFATYTPDQIAWRDSGRAERLSMLVCEFEERKARK